MKPVQEVLAIIHKLKKSGTRLNKFEVLSVLEATKSITAHKDVINTLILFLNTLSTKEKRSTKNLTNRERQVLQLIGRAIPNKEIAKILSLKTSTVETHRKNIRKKLGLVGKGKLLEFAILYNLQPSILETL